jgi:hypothetical protein
MSELSKNIHLHKALLLVLAICLTGLTAQSSTKKKKIFKEAESYFLFENYEMANQLYLLLEKPDNMNIKFKIGVCYLNILGEKEKSIPYLEDAIKNASFDSKTNLLKEKRAPLDAYFFLAKAYMINNDLEKAITTFQNFSTLAKNTNVQENLKNFAFIDQMIKACKNAIEYQANPVNFTKTLITGGINQGAVNDNPAVSYDGNALVYTERRGLANAIFYSRKVNGNWQPPVEINSVLRAGDDCSSCALNSDGTKLFLYKNDGFDGNIYISDYIDGNWTPITKLNRNINTKFYESHASVSSDGKRLYFTSNREGGFGGLDIYVSESDGTGDWKSPVNIGPAVNTRFNEDTPFLSINDSLLFFSSEGHSTMGGYDVFCSSIAENSWKPPLNLGYPVNSTDDDRFFQPYDNGRHAFYSMPTDYKKKDIFFLDMGKLLTEIKGKYSLNDTTLTFDENYSIHLLNKTTGDTVDVGFPNKYTGRYSFMTGPGEYRLIFTGLGYFSQSVDTSILQYDLTSSITIDVTMIRDPSVPRKFKVYDKINLSEIPVVQEIDSSVLVRDMKVNDLDDRNVMDSDILYYTVQVMALYRPVDISYFKYVSDIKVLYNEKDLFYRYTTGRFETRDEAYAHKNELISKGYPDDLFIKKVSRLTSEKPVPGRRFYTLQLKATKLPLDINTIFKGYEGVRENKEADGLYHYLYGNFSSYSEAASALRSIRDEEFKDAFVRTINVVVDK